MDGRHSARWVCALVIGSVFANGCASHAINRDIARSVMSEIPRELDKASHPIYRVESPDILLIEAINNIRPANTRLKSGDQVSVRLQNGLPLRIQSDPETAPLEYQMELEREVEFKVITGLYLVGADGTLDFGPAYGKVRVDGLTLDEARIAIDQHLRDTLGLIDPRLSVTLPSVAGKQAIAGEHLVRPDGTISLGVYGSVYVAGMTLDEVKFSVETHLSQFLHQPEVYVDVLSYNSKVVYIIMDGGGYGEQVLRLPCTGNETVLDAISQVQGLSQVSSKRIWIARPAPAELGYAQVLDVHWKAITAEGITTTNYQLFPGDRIYVQADKLIATDNFLGKLLSPVERVFGIILLGSGAAQAIDFYGDPNFSN